MCKLPFRKHSSKAPSNWKKRKFFSLFCGIHGARREEGGDQEAIPPAPPGRISHRDSKKPERVIVKGKEDCSQPIICEPGAGRAAESSERYYCCRHGSRTQDLTLPSRKHVSLCAAVDDASSVLAGVFGGVYPVAKSAVRDLRCLNSPLNSTWRWSDTLTSPPRGFFDSAASISTRVSLRPSALGTEQTSLPCYLDCG
jgi:hypothetical protein